MQGGPGAAAGRALLRRAVLTLPVPASPPERSTRELVGLHLVQAALRPQHVDRVSEFVSLVDATHMARRVEIDVDLARLPPEKVAALTIEKHRSADEPALWVPVARHRRDAVGPVVPRDGTEAAVPRMTTRETNRLLASALVRVFRDLSRDRGHATTAADGEDTVAARWLVESAILALVQDGRRHWPEEPPVPPVDRTPSLALMDLPPGFYDLLHTVTTEQVLVVRLPARRHQTRIAYQAPELGAVARRRVSRPGRYLSAREFTVSYVTTIPADVDSFHVTLVVPEHMEVRRMVMGTDADGDAVAILERDVRDHARYFPDAPGDGLAAFEYLSIRARMEELGRRRLEDLAEYEEYLATLHRRLGYRAPRWRRRPAARWSTLREVVAEARSRRAAVSALGRLETADRARLADEGPDRAAVMTALADEMRTGDVGTDLHLDDDPRENAGHVQWRRHGAGLGLVGEREVTARVHVALADARPSAAVRLLWFLLGNLVLVTALLGAFVVAPAVAGDREVGRSLRDGVDFGVQIEVLVTLLLLVPGLVLGAVDLSRRRTVVSDLRVVPVVLGWSSIAVNALLAVTIVAWPRDTPFPPVASASFLGALALLCVLALAHVLAGGSARLYLVPPYRDILRWLLREAAVSPVAPEGRLLRPSVVFDARGRAGAP